MKVLQKKRSVTAVLIILLAALAIAFAACSDGGEGNGNQITDPERPDPPPTEVVKYEYVDYIEVMKHPTRPSGVGGMVDLEDAEFKLYWVDQNKVRVREEYVKIDHPDKAKQFYSMRLTTPSYLGEKPTDPDIWDDDPGDDSIFDKTKFSKDADRLIQVFHKQSAPWKTVSASVLVPAILPLRAITVVDQLFEYWEDDYYLDLDEQGIIVWADYFVEAYNANWEGNATDADGAAITTFYRKSTFPQANPRVKMILPNGANLSVKADPVKGEITLMGIITRDFFEDSDAQLPLTGGGTSNWQGINGDNTATDVTVNVDRFYKVKDVKAGINWEDAGWGTPYTDIDTITVAQWRSRLDAVKPDLTVTYEWANGYGVAKTIEPKVRTWEYFQALELAYRVNMDSDKSLGVGRTGYPTTTPALSGARGGLPVEMEFSYWGKPVKTPIDVYTLRKISVSGTAITLPFGLRGASLAGSGDFRVRQALSKAFYDAGGKIEGEFALGTKTTPKNMPSLLDDAGNWRTDTGSGVRTAYTVQFFDQGAVADTGFDIRFEASTPTKSIPAGTKANVSSTIPTGSAAFTFRMVIQADDFTGGLARINNQRNLTVSSVKLETKPGEVEVWVNPVFTKVSDKVPVETTGSAAANGTITLGDIFKLANKPSVDGPINWTVNTTANGDRITQVTDDQIVDGVVTVTRADVNTTTYKLYLTATIPKAKMDTANDNETIGNWTQNVVLEVYFPVESVTIEPAGKSVTITTGTGQIGQANITVVGGQGLDTAANIKKVLRWIVIEDGGTNLETAMLSTDGSGNVNIDENDGSGATLSVDVSTEEATLGVYLPEDWVTGQPKSKTWTVTGITLVGP